MRYRSTYSERHKGISFATAGLMIFYTKQVNIHFCISNHNGQEHTEWEVRWNNLTYKEYIIAFLLHEEFDS